MFNKTNFKDNNKIISIEDRAIFWSSVSKIKLLDFWLGGKKTYKKIEIQKRESPKDYLESAVNLLKEKNFEVVYVDLTNDLLRKYGFSVVKVIIPQLQPLYLDERYSYIQEDRIYNAPVKMDFYKKPKLKSELNKTPHPFL